MEASIKKRGFYVHNITRVVVYSEIYTGYHWLPLGKIIRCEMRGIYACTKAIVTRISHSVVDVSDHFPRIDTSQTVANYDFLFSYVNNPLPAFPVTPRADDESTYIRPLSFPLFNSCIVSRRSGYEPFFFFSPPEAATATRLGTSLTYLIP